MEGLREPDTIALSRTNSLLKMAEKTPGAGQGKRHGAEFAEQPVPFGDRELALRRWDIVKEVGQPLQASRGEREGHVDGVKNPPKHLLAGCPGGIALGEFGQGNWFGAGSEGESGRKIVSMVCIRLRRVREAVVGWATARKSSTKTSTAETGRWK